MFRKLDQQKKIGTVSVIIGFALLFLTLILIPLKTAGGWKYFLLIPAALLILAPVPVMWKDGIRQMKQKPSPVSPSMTWTASPTTVTPQKNSWTRPRPTMIWRATTRA